MLDYSIACSYGEAVLEVTLYLLRTVRFNLFLAILKERPMAIDLLTGTFSRGIGHES